MPKHTKGLSYLDAARNILSRSNRSLNIAEIIEKAREQRLIDFDVPGATKTPDRSMNSRLSTDIRRKKHESDFKRTGSGRYALRTSSESEHMGRPYARRIKDTDQVLVFPVEELDSLGRFHGIRTDYERYAAHLLRPGIAFLMSRKEAEATDRFKQPLSYVMVRQGAKILRFTRGAISNVSKYLRGQNSIGIGGHVDATDWRPLLGEPDGGYNSSVMRELSEEVGLSSDVIQRSKLRIVGVLNDDSTPLGRSHFAFIHLLELEGSDISIRKGEKSINDLRFVDVAQLGDEFQSFEYWSKLCIQEYFGHELAIQCHITERPGFSLTQRGKYIHFVGYIGCGKSEACNLLVSDFGYTLVPCSRILTKLMKCQPIEVIGRKRLQDLGLAFISSENGHDHFARAIFDFIHSSAGSKFVLDGLRFPETLDRLSDLLHDQISTIFIEPTIDNLHAYFRKRERSSLSFMDFLTIVYHPVEMHIERFWPIAQVIIYNHGSYYSYISGLRKYFAERLVG